MSGRIFEKTLYENYRYRLSLKIELFELKNQFELYLEVGYGIPNVDNNKEFYFTSCRKLGVDADLQCLSSSLNHIKEEIMVKFKGERFLVDKLSLKVTSEKQLPIIYEKSDITVSEALEDFELIKARVLTISGQVIPSKPRCFIL